MRCLAHCSGLSFLACVFIVRKPRQVQRAFIHNARFFPPNEYTDTSGVCFPKIQARVLSIADSDREAPPNPKLVWNYRIIVMVHCQRFLSRDQHASSSVVAPLPYDPRCRCIADTSSTGASRTR